MIDRKHHPNKKKDTIKNGIQIIEVHLHELLH